MSALASEAPAPSAPSPGLSTRRILAFYVPLALSWIFMSVESPIATGLIGRLAEAKVHTAAFFALMGIALFIESPVIDLLSTSTTLAKDRASYLVLRRFTLWLMAWVTLLHAAVPLTPLYDVVARGILGLAPEVAEAAHFGLIVMIPWSAFIGWRRFLQGILIRHGQTRIISFGTFLRVLTIAGVGFGLYAFAPGLHSVVLVAWALVASVAVEAVFVHFAAQRTLREHYILPPEEPAAEPLSMRRLIAFHAPLTGTTMVMLTAAPIVAAALARVPEGVTMQSAWQVAIALLWPVRTVVFALPEVVITLAKTSTAVAAMRRFCVQVGLLTSAIGLGLAVSGLDRVFFTKVLDVEPSRAELAHLGFFIGCTTPLLGALMSYVRGMLTLHHRTQARLWAILAGVSTLIGSLSIGVAFQVQGVILAATALTLGMVAELVVLWWNWRRVSRIHTESVPT